VLAYCESAAMTDSANVWREQLLRTEAWSDE
jgi:hypothetical protein